MKWWEKLWYRMPVLTDGEKSDLIALGILVAFYGIAIFAGGILLGLGWRIAQWL